MAFADLKISEYDLLQELFEAHTSGKYSSEFHAKSAEGKGWFIQLKGVNGNEDKYLGGFTNGDLAGLSIKHYLINIPRQSGHALSLSQKAFEQFHLSQAASRLQSSEAIKPSDTDMKNKEQNINIFISHSSHDVEIAKALITLLRSALNIPSKSIRCTSVDGYMFDPGTPVDEQIRREVRESKIFIGLITPASTKSSYVLFELGARWGAELDLFPLLASGADASMLPAPIAGRNALRCDNVAQVHHLIGTIARKLNLDFDNPSAYQKCIDELVSASKATHEQANVRDTQEKATISAPEPPLSQEEKDLLVAAADRGDISLCSSDEGKWIRAGSETFYDQADPAVAVMYIEGLESLCQRSLVKYEGGILYVLTSAGFRVARGLKKPKDKSPSVHQKQSSGSHSTNIQIGRDATIQGESTANHGRQTNTKKRG